MYTCICICIYVHFCIYIHIHIYLFTYLNIYIDIDMHIYKYTHTHTHTHAHTHTHTHTHTQTHTHTHKHTHTHTGARGCRFRPKFSNDRGHDAHAVSRRGSKPIFAKEPYFPATKESHLLAKNSNLVVAEVMMHMQLAAKVQCFTFLQ